MEDELKFKSFPTSNWSKTCFYAALTTLLAGILILFEDGPHFLGVTSVAVAVSLLVLKGIRFNETARYWGLATMGSILIAYAPIKARFLALTPTDTLREAQAIYWKIWHPALQRKLLSGASETSYVAISEFKREFLSECEAKEKLRYARLALEVYVAVESPPETALVSPFPQKAEATPPNLCIQLINKLALALPLDVIRDYPALEALRAKLEHRNLGTDADHSQ